MEKKNPPIIVEDLTMAYGGFVIQRDLNFTVNRGDIFIIMGGSGCGKSTLLRHLVGLQRPAKGRVRYGDVSFWDAGPEEQERIMPLLRHPLPERRPLELDDPGRERGAAAPVVHGPRARSRSERSPR